MAHKGPPPTPVERLKARGTFREDRHGPADLVPIAPIRTDLMPSALDAIAVALAAGEVWLAESDSITVAMLAEALSDRAEMRAAVDAREVLRDKDVSKTLRDLDKHILSLLQVLGFTPTDRARLGLTEVKRASKVEQLRAKSAANRA